MLDTQDIIGLEGVPGESSSSHSWQQSCRLWLIIRELAKVFLRFFFFFFFFNQILNNVATSKFQVPPKPKIGDNWGQLWFHFYT